MELINVVIVSTVLCYMCEGHFYEVTGEYNIGLRLQKKTTFIKIPKLYSIYPIRATKYYDQEIIDITHSWFKQLILQPDSTVYTRSFRVGDSNYCCDEYGSCMEDASCIITPQKRKRSIWSLLGTFISRSSMRGVSRLIPSRSMAGMRGIGSASKVSRISKFTQASRGLSKLNGVWKVASGAGTLGMVGFTIYDSVMTNMRLTNIEGRFKDMDEFSTSVLTRFENASMINLQQSIEMIQMNDTIHSQLNNMMTYVEEMEVVNPKFHRFMGDYQLCLSRLTSHRICDTLLTRDKVIKIFSSFYPNSTSLFFDEALVDEYLRLIPIGYINDQNILIMEIEFVILDYEFLTGRVYTRLGTANNEDPCVNSPEYLYELRGELVEIEGTEMCTKLQQTLYCFGGVEIKTTDASTCWESPLKLRKARDLYHTSPEISILPSYFQHDVKTRLEHYNTKSYNDSLAQLIIDKENLIKNNLKLSRNVESMSVPFPLIITSIVMSSLITILLMLLVKCYLKQASHLKKKVFSLDMNMVRLRHSLGVNEPL